MRRKSHRRSINKIRKYTAFVPKTVKATTDMGKSVIRKINYFLTNTVSTLKKTTKAVDRRAAKSIRTLTKRRIRK
jgi:hypothetical protein